MTFSNSDPKLDALLISSESSIDNLRNLFTEFAHATADHIQICQEYLPKVQSACERWEQEYTVATGIRHLSTALAKYYMTHFSEVESPAKEALSVLETTGERDYLGVAHMVCGSNFRSLGETDDAVKHLLIGSELIDPDGLFSVYACYTYYQLAEINVYIKDFEAAESHYEKTIELAERSNQVVPLFRAYDGLGNLAMNRGNYDSAKSFLLKSLKIEGLTEGQLSRGYCDLGILCTREKELERATEYLEMSYKMRMNAKLEDAASTSLINWAEALLDLRENDLAIEKLTEALAISSKFDSKAKAAASYNLLWKAHEQKGNWQQATKAFKSYDQLQNEITSVKLQNIYKLKNRKIQEQKALIEEKNQEITDSITYAKRIQEAILPPMRLVKERIENSFILYKPKDIVAGDFYWMEPAGDWTIFAAADCTGHGVPGAMVSVVCSNALNRAVREFGLKEPGKILDKTLEIVIERFEQSEEEVKDGMDIAICAYNPKTRQLQYAGANNALWVVTEQALTELGEEVESRKLTLGAWNLYEIKADKQPIGRYHDPKPYTNHTFSLGEGDSIYIFSDGYADQFGGPKGKKLKYKPFKELVLSSQSMSMIEQHDLFNDKFEKWRGDYEQVDDVCMIGMKA